MKHIKYILSFLLILSVIFSSGCGFNKVSENELKIGVSGVEGEFNPFYVEATADKQISNQIYQTIQRRNSSNKMVNLCGNITYEIDEENVKYTVSINKNLCFSDGTPVTIDDVIFFYYFISDATYDGPYKDFYLNDIEGIKEYYFDDANYAENILILENDEAVKAYTEKNYSDGINVSEIKGIKKINDYTCTVQFNSHNINAVSALNVPIISKEFYSSIYIKGLTSEVKNYFEDAPGSGAYYLEEYKNGKASLSANKYYYEKPDFTKLTFVDYSDKEESLLDDVVSGKIDVTTVTASSERIAKLSENGSKYFITNDDGYYSMFFDSERLDILERKALSGICDLSAVTDAEFGKYYNVPLRPMSIRFDEYPDNITEKLFSSSDFTNYQLRGTRKITSLNAYCYDDFSDELLVEFSKILSDKGISININKVTYDEFTAAIKASKADIWIDKVSDGATSNKYDYYNSLGSKNISGFNNADVDLITSKIETSVGIYDRSQLTEKMLDLISEQAIEQPICQLQNVTVYNTENISENSFDNEYDYDDFTYVISQLKSN